MRIAILLLLAFIFSCSTPQQKDIQKRKVKLHYENASGEKGLSTFEYDGNGSLVKSRWELLDGSRYSTNFHCYNEKGLEIEKYREFSDSLVTSLKSFYDEKGLKTAEEFVATDGREGITSFEYNEKGHLKSAVCNKYNGWIDGQMEFTCNENGQLLSANATRKKTPHAKVSYTYDNEGNLIKEFWDFEGKWNQTFSYEYETPKPTSTSANVFIPENSRYRIKNENYNFNNESQGPSIYKYNKIGQLIEKIFIRSDSLKTRTTFKYDDKGILTSSTRTYADGKKGTFSYTYNQDRKLVKREFHCTDETSSLEQYSYDEKGILNKAIWQNFDTWLSGEISFTYNRAGLIDKGFFKGNNGFDATLTFNYNSQGNLSRIHWDFSFGKMQEYLFEWEETTSTNPIIYEQSKVK